MGGSDLPSYNGFHGFAASFLNSLLSFVQVTGRFLTCLMACSSLKFDLVRNGRYV